MNPMRIVIFLLVLKLYPRLHGHRLAYTLGKCSPANLWPQPEDKDSVCCLLVFPGTDKLMST